MSRTLLQNTLVGMGYIDLRSTYKYAILRGQLAVLMAVICTAYIIIDSLNGVYHFIPWYTVGVACALTVIVLNRKRNYVVATYVLVIGSNLLVYFFAAVDHPFSGVFFFFAATAAVGFVLFDSINSKLRIFFVGLSVVLGLLAYLGNWSVLPPPLQDEYYVKINFVTNFLVGLLSITLIIYFIINRNKESESSLIANQVLLEELANELEKSKNRFAMAVESSKAGIYEWEIATNKVVVSSRWKNLLGYEESDQLDVSLEFFMKLVHPEDAERTSAQVQKAMGKGDSYQNELRMKHKNGEYHWFLDSGLVRKQNGEPQIAVGSIIDIHDRKMAEMALIDKNEELQKINTELDRFVYSASHDMRAPLSTLLGLIEVARLNNDPEEIANYFDMMKNRIHTMEGFINDITDYSRNARLEIRLEKVNVRSLVNEISKSFKFLATNAGVALEIDINPKMIINADPGRLSVILNNLFANAIKYHDPDKTDRKVMISANIEGPDVVIAITDNGLGIKREYLDKIFNMFFRASEISDGSGLGLYIVKETIQRIKGNIKCTSEVGNGTSFEIRIPADHNHIE